MTTVVSTMYQSITSGQTIRKGFQLLLLVCAAGLILWAGQWAEKREFQVQADSIRRAIDIHTLGLRADATRFSVLPYTVSRHPDVIAALGSKGDQALRQRANRYLEDVNLRAGSDALYIMDLKGITVAASNWDNPKSFVGQDYSNRPYFMDAISGKTGMFYGIGQTTAIPGLFIAAPAYRDGKVLGVVAIKVSLRDIEAAWADLPAPIMMSDSRGIFFLGSIPSWKYQAKRLLGEDDLAWVRRHKQYGEHLEFPMVPWHIESEQGQPGYLIQTTVDGKKHRYLAFDETLSDLGWTLTIMADYEPVVWARVITWVLGTLGTGLLLLGGLYWQLRERRLAEHRTARQELEVRVRERTLELHEAHAFQKSMENSLLVGMRARDLEGRITYVNSAFCDMTGFRSDELIGRLPPYPYWHPDDLARHWNDNETALSGQAAFSGFESRIRHHDGHDVFTMIYTAPLIDASGKHKGWMSSVVDITEQRKADARQRLLDAQLQHTGRLASLGEMASTLAHELNQPLMALRNFASAANAFAAQGEQKLLIDSLEEITAQAQRSADIVRRIRGFVRPLTVGIQMCDINTVVTNVLALLKPEIRLQHTQIVTRLKDNLPTVTGDRVLLEQVVLNLVVNSLQAMQLTPHEGRLIEIETLLINNSVCVSVTDCGSGISADIADHLFQPFFTTKPEGLGLGLNICRTIVESHRGQLSFVNRPAGGTIFTLKLQVST